MSDVWAPPPPSNEHRLKVPFCGARRGRSRCDLYRDHEARNHRDSHTHETWPVEET